MFPRSHPRQPTTWELQDKGWGFPPNYLHQSWRDYLYWDSKLESRAGRGLWRWCCWLPCAVRDSGG
jgi:hypothetical protein